MKDVDIRTIIDLANRSDRFVYFISFFFSLLGAILAIISGGPGIWGAWVPFCFIVVPPIHYLCREVIRLRQRIEELEKHSG